jgi:hypothetical protein
LDGNGRVNEFLDFVGDGGDVLATVDDLLAAASMLRSLSFLRSTLELVSFLPRVFTARFSGTEDNLVVLLGVTPLHI